MSAETKVFGVVAQVGEEWVETEFQVVGGFPTVPVGSFYRRNAEQRYPIENHSGSLLKVYLSYHAGLIAFVCLLLGVLEPPATPLADTLLFLGAGLGLLCCFARFRVGKVTAAEAGRREVHRQVTGINALPAMMPRRLVENLHQALERKWQKSHQRWNAPADWREAIAPERDGDTLAFLAVLASLQHQLESDAVHGALARKAWSLLQAAGGAHDLESLSPEEALAVLADAKEGPKAEEPQPAAAPQVAQAQVAKVAKAARVPREKKASRGIKIRCERCEGVTRVPDDYAGRTGLCPTCNKAIRVPSRESLRTRRAA
ncbi:MAG: hypothetical protein AB7N76_01455 [Planctomycetota bacterium]